MKLYVDNTNCLLRPTKTSKRDDPSLFNSKSAIFDSNWEIDGVSTFDLFQQRKYRKNKHSFQTAKRLEALIRGVMNCFEFVTSHGLAQIFSIDKSTAVRIMKSLPTVNHNGVAAVSSRYGLIAAFNLLMKNQYATQRRDLKAIDVECYFFQQFDNSATKALETLPNDMLLFEELLRGKQYSGRTPWLIAVEKNVISRLGKPVKIQWVGAIPFLLNPNRAAVSDSISLTVCGVSGIPVGNYKKKSSRYLGLAERPFASLMFPQRRDLDVKTNDALSLISTWPIAINTHCIRIPSREKNKKRQLIPGRFSFESRILRRGLRYEFYVLRPQDSSDEDTIGSNL